MTASTASTTVASCTGFMTKDSAKGLSDMVPVWKSDRFARNRYNGARYKNFRIKNEVKIIPARENISERSKEIILDKLIRGFSLNREESSRYYERFAKPAR